MRNTRVEEGIKGSISTFEGVKEIVALRKSLKLIKYKVFLPIRVKL